MGENILGGWMKNHRIREQSKIYVPLSSLFLTLVPR